MNALGSVGLDLDCPTCDGTGYANKWIRVKIDGFYSPGPIKRWEPQTGGVIYNGECSVKVDAQYKSVLNRTDFLEMDGVQWHFESVSDYGKAMGQPRLILALTRKD